MSSNFHHHRVALLAAVLATGLVTPASVRAQLETLPAGRWSYVPMPEIRCRELGHDGEVRAGLAVRPASRPSNRVVIVMQGGGTCATAESCDANPSSFTESQFRVLAQSGVLSYLNWGIFAPRWVAPSNDLADYHQVWIPYCSGDMHAGDVAYREIPQQPAQQHFGYENTRLYFEKIVELFETPLATEGAVVMLAGVSAGGYGASFNAPRLDAMLPSGTRMILVSDSAPLFDGLLVPEAFSDALRDQYGFSETFLADCAGCGEGATWLADWQDHLLATMPHVTQALISSGADSTVTAVLEDGLFGTGTGIDVTRSSFVAGLDRIRARMEHATQTYGTPTATFFIKEPVIEYFHVFSIMPYYYAVRARDRASREVELRDWMYDLFERSPTAHDHVGF